MNGLNPDQVAGEEPATAYLHSLSHVLQALPVQQIHDIADTLRRAHDENGTVWIFGNGGSAATANHLAVDLLKVCGIRAVSLCATTPVLTAYANDMRYEGVFMMPLARCVDGEDVALAISGSGNSKNVLLAVEAANGLGVQTIGFTGFDGGELAKRAKQCIIVPSHDIQQVEDAHLAICHLICRLLA